jgi:hypothetical protein
MPPVAVAVQVMGEPQVAGNEALEANCGGDMRN